MKNLVLTVMDLLVLADIQKAVLKGDSLSKNQRDVLSNFLSELLKGTENMSYQIPVDSDVAIELCDLKSAENDLPKWAKLFLSLPGSEVCVTGEMLENGINNNGSIALAIAFAPSLEHRKRDALFDIYLMYDGTAKIIIELVEDAEEFAELYNFKGSWKEAYFLLLETMRKGWPQENFPKELLKFLSE